MDDAIGVLANHSNTVLKRLVPNRATHHKKFVCADVEKSIYFIADYTNEDNWDTSFLKDYWGTPVNACLIR